MNIYDILNQLNISYEEVNHKAIYSYEDALKENIASKIDGVECKNLFVKSKTKYYLIFIEANKKADLKALSTKVEDSRLVFASEEELKNILNLEVGSVTPLGIINDKNNLVTILLDKELIGQKVLLHPNVNTKTISITLEDLIKFIENRNHSYLLF